MTATRYFTYTNPDGSAQALARVGPGRAERVTRGAPAWLSVPSLWGLVFEGDMNWDEVDHAGAAAFLARMGVDAGALAQVVA